ncbi:zinc finger protein 239-like [Mobula hypostoma]|uniref:zinc finger protein 239-like n=1 Tax=Mobula hypostoma TaxID=723540 RepID=UPI002FC38046
MCIKGMSEVKNDKESIYRNLEHNTPVFLSLSRYLRSGARDSLDHPSCSDCGEGFTRSSDQLACPSFYTGKRPFTCSDSGNGFPQSSQLNVRQQVHTGTRPFTCSVCEKEFSWSSHLWTHQSVHTGKRLVIC